MPTLIRFVIVILMLAGLAYAGAFALVYFVELPSQEVVHPVAKDRFAD